MKERPILFSGPMVRAILEGRKIQTRRIMKPIPAYPDSFFMKRIEIHGAEARFFRRNAENAAHIFYCPCGAPGDRLWIRETWRIGAWRDFGRKVAVDYRASRELVQTPWLYLDEAMYRKARRDVLRELEKQGILPDEEGHFSWEYGQAPISWRPSIHMPRWASRITLEITAVRVERLQNITVDDCMAEGIDCDKKISNPDPKTHNSIENWNLTYAQYLYKELWDSLNGKRPGCAWANNPWVWIVEFERVN